jgi:hypothetical protein
VRRTHRATCAASWVSPGARPWSAVWGCCARRSASTSSCPGSTLNRGRAIGSGTPADLLRAHHDLRARRRAPVRGLARSQLAITQGGGLRARQRRQLAITQRGGPITRQRRPIASLRDCITRGSGVDTPLGAVLAFLGAAIANVARDVMDLGVAALHEVAIAGFLIAVGRGLIVVRRGLVAVRSRLVGVCEGLLAIGERLHVLDGLRTRSDALLLPPQSPRSQRNPRDDRLTVGRPQQGLHTGNNESQMRPVPTRNDGLKLPRAPDGRPFRQVASGVARMGAGMSAAPAMTRQNEAPGVGRRSPGSGMVPVSRACAARPRAGLEQARLGASDGPLEFPEVSQRLWAASRTSSRGTGPSADGGSEPLPRVLDARRIRHHGPRHRAFWLSSRVMARALCARAARRFSLLHERLGDGRHPAGVLRAPPRDARSARHASPTGTPNPPLATPGSTAARVAGAIGWHFWDSQPLVGCPRERERNKTRRANAAGPAGFARRLKLRASAR